MPWYSSWIPELPNINFGIPGIQGRFVSFVLKKSLGHFLKPGQLDYHQIDSQIGSGYVQINDLELNPEAINSYLHGLPIAFHDGTISSVKARIPWPNPLASTLGFSLKSLNLVFHVVPLPPPVFNLDLDVDLTASVASVAESFIHEELSPREAVTLWQTLHSTTLSPSDIEEQAIPGGLDINVTDDDRHKVDMDPEGVSIFATLIERLLARFEFDAEDLIVTLIHPENMSLTLSLEEIRYRTVSKDTNHDSTRGESRTLSLNGCLLAARNLDSKMPLTFPPTACASTTSASPNTSRPLSRASSSSSIDEETQFMMSQSLAFLPPKADPLSASASSSMYQSALSSSSRVSLDHPLDEISEPVPEANLVPPLSKVPLNVPVSSTQTDDRLLSFGSLPIDIQLTTPSPEVKASNDDPFILHAEDRVYSDEILQVAVSMGVIACALRPWHINGLLQLTQSLARPYHKAPKVDTGKSFNTPLRINTQLRGIVLLLLPSRKGVCSSMTDNVEFFFDRCLVPPPLDCGYTRIHLDGLTASLICSAHQQQNSIAPSSATSNAAINSSLEFAVADMSIFFFSKPPLDNKSSQLSAFPFLLTDPHLATQYNTSHIHPRDNESYDHLPRFDIIDWTEDKCQNFGTRLSAWRVRLPKHASTTSYPVPSAIRLFNQWSVTSSKGKQSVPQGSEELDVHISPMHIRLDLEIIIQDGGLLSFFEDLVTLRTQHSDQDSVSSETTIDQYLSSQGNRQQRAKPTGQDDSDVHPIIGISPEDLASNHTRTTDKPRQSTTVKCSLVQISMRCPPPPNRNNRSGALIISLNDINLSAGLKRPRPSARFVATDSFAGNSDMSDEAILLNAEFGRAVVACSSVGAQVATAFISLGPLTHDTDFQDQTPSLVIPHPPPLQPHVSIIKPTSKVVPIRAFSVDIPSVHVDISKPTFDALQYWADDVAQLLEYMSSKVNDGMDAGVGDSRDTSLIGSRFFAKSRSGSGSALSTSRNDASAETIVKLTVTETFVRVMLPRSDSDTSQSRPFDIIVSDLDVLAELNSESQQQTILTVGAMDLVVMNTPRSGVSQRFISLTSPRSLSAAPKSMVKLRLSTAIMPEVNAKETRIKLTLSSFTSTFFPDIQWISDLTKFAKNPPGTFEAVIPSDRTRIHAKILDGSIRAFAPNHPGAAVVYLQELEFSTDVIGDSRESSFRINATGLALLAADDISSLEDNSPSALRGVSVWMAAGYALLTEVIKLDTNVIRQLNAFPVLRVTVDHIVLHLHLCADTLTSVTAFTSDLISLFKSQEDLHQPTTSSKEPTIVNRSRKAGDAMLSSVEDLAFKRAPEVGPAGDMIYDDLPTNPDYLDASFGAAAGLRELRDDDLDDFDDEELLVPTGGVGDTNTISKVGGETIKIFESGGLGVIEDHFLIIPPEKSHSTSDFGEPYFSIVVADSHFRMLLYSGYDWAKTRKAIEEEVKEMRKKLARIRQLVASGQMQDSTIEDTSALLFNSVHIGLEQDDDALGEPSALIAAIDEELREDFETASQSSWQSLKPSNTTKPRIRRVRTHGKRLTRSKTPSIEFCLSGLQAEFDQYQQDNPLVARTFVTIKDLEILDHIKTSTWKKFLTQLRSDSRGNVRETDSNMVRIELRTVRPVPGHSSEEVRLRAKILPLRLYVDQDAVDFLKKFFSFKDSNAQATERISNDEEAYIQLAEIFPIDLKLDYKPRRVDYRALKEGRTIELMNFFHFDGAEMTLRHITLAGVTGWPKLFEMLNDLWTPDVKATQLAEVISGVAPIRSVVNVGSGVADLILLPIAQYKKDGRIVRGLQKGATAFVKSTAIEAVKMGAKLATGTQVILEQAEDILGGQFEVPITTETLQIPVGEDLSESDGDGESTDVISRYAQQPADLKEGIQSAVKSLRRNLSSAAQTILAVPMEVYERSSNEGPVRSVVRAVPIAVLKPMIGASEAVSKTLLGLHNTLDPNVRHDNEAKYKFR
ncbi:hypothetical protein BYT27DRAFT_7203788 [Phlegmacium glaucopus]|nr:hypothetical protein BYT27DRAFT_7203788 [Phlegmacium glaucopus]